MSKLFGLLVETHSGFLMFLHRIRRYFPTAVCNTAVLISRVVHVLFDSTYLHTIQVKRFHMEEEYRDVVGFEGYFQVSNLGNVFSKRSKRLLKLTKSKTGYWTFVTRINGIPHFFLVHRLVAEAFIPNPESKPFVNHIDGCKTNNMLSNLEWVTPTENLAHALATGLRKRKLTADQVREIRASTKTNRELASIYGLSHSNIWYIKSRERYKDVPDSQPSLSGVMQSLPDGQIGV